MRKLIAAGILFFLSCEGEAPDSEVFLNLEGEKKEIDRKVYGHFIENLGECIYGGIWDDTPTPPVRVIHGGLRTDVLELIKALKPPVVRFPGGLYADAYHWMNGIGEPSKRPTLINGYWGMFGEIYAPPDTNQFGTDEFMAFLEEIGAEGYINVNYSTGTPEEAAGWVEYVNGSTDTIFGRMRAENGHPEPYNVKIWGIGNEIYGWWAFGHTDAESYARRYLEFADAMLKVDPSIKLTAVGADNDWNRKVLDIACEKIDYLTIHTYLPGGYYPRLRNTKEEYYAIVAAPLFVERTLREVERVLMEKPCDKEIKIALDEWNVSWLLNIPSYGKEFRTREMIYTAGMFAVFHRLANLLGMANYAQLVNVLGLIYTTETSAWVTPPYYAFLLFSNYSYPYALSVTVHSPVFSSPRTGDIPPMEGVPFIEATATTDGRGKISIFLINRDAEKSHLVRLIINPDEKREFKTVLLTSSTPFSKTIHIKEGKSILSRGDAVEVPPHSILLLYL